jgi:Ni/Fe-hydrogenase subunit HybB-like protein
MLAQFRERDVHRTCYVSIAAKYFPSVPEFLIAAGVLAFGLLVFSLGARFLPLYPPQKINSSD